jgi:hypothetical protein
MTPRKFIIVALFTLFIFCEKTTGQAEDLREEVEKLRTTVETLINKIEEQDQRIVALEKAIKTLAGSGNESLPTIDSVRKQSAGRVEGWKNPANWKRIKPGMSEAQVRAILGSPTSTGGLTWYYEGDVPGSGTVSGNISWLFHRVSGSYMPVF